MVALIIHLFIKSSAPVCSAGIREEEAAGIGPDGTGVEERIELEEWV